MATDACIAVDWGTTNRRAYRLAANGRIVDQLEDCAGVLSPTAGDYLEEIARLRDRFGPLPVIAAGMVGSTRGWHEVPYVEVPATLSTLAARALDVAQRVWIVPGVPQRTPNTDVMRGEEMQALGAVTAGLAPATGLFCQPGTHNKWISIEDERITRFATAMTGELFALIRTHGILAGMLEGEVADGEAFRDGLARGAGACDLTAALFGVRAAVLLGTLAADNAAAYASGILIGADVGARDDIAGRDVHLLASGPLASLYATAIEAAGGRPVTLDSGFAFTAAAHAIRDLLP